MWHNSNNLHINDKRKYQMSKSTQVSRVEERSSSQPPRIQKSFEAPLRRRRSKSNNGIYKIFQKFKTKYSEKLAKSMIDEPKEKSKYVDTVLYSNNCVNCPRYTANFKEDISNVKPFIKMSKEARNNFKDLEEFKIEKQLGKGSYGTVYLTHNANGYEYAVKILSYSRLLNRKQFTINCEKDKEHLVFDMKAYVSLEHHNILKLHAVFGCLKDDNIYLLYELALKPLMTVPTDSPFTEVESVFYFHDVICGLKYLHLNKIPHLDIKPSNLLLSVDGVVKVADFGLAQLIDSDYYSFYTVAGSLGFCAPEILDKTTKSISLVNLFLSDVWSLGITLYCFLYGNIPWDTPNLMHLTEQIMNLSPNFPAQPIINPALYDLLGRMLCKCPQNRITLEEIFAHPWVNISGFYHI